MADAAIEFLLESLREVLLYHVNLINETRTRYSIESLESDLRLFKAFLRDTEKKPRKNERTKHMVGEIRDVVYEVEDIIEAFLTNAILEGRPEISSSRLWKTPVDLDAVRQRVETFIRKNMSRITSSSDFDSYEKPEPWRQRKVNMVGFVDVREDLVRRLTQETEYFDVISLIGMFGSGKTTLAWKIFNDERIVYEFPTRIWLTISQEFSDKDIFLGILKHFATINDNLRAKTDHELADLVVNALIHCGRFLIVMDDVWETVDWERLHVALPDSNTNGKVLITSRSKGVGKFASKLRPPYNLRLFTFEESWELFRLEALGQLNCPSGLEEVARKIAKNCGGLPLVIVVIGGILATRYSGSDTIATRRYWEKVSKHVGSFLSEMDPADRIRRSISLSYLPYYLRTCFLYFGLFPKDYEIPVSKLTRMWIAEGFIQQKHDSSLEETAEMYLEDLINGNLVKSVKFKPDGKVKTCWVHGILHDFCRIEAANQYFLQEFKYKSSGQFAPSTTDIVKYRRISLHSKCLDFFSLRPFGPRVRSFLCISNDKYVVSHESSSNMMRTFKLLRVLDVMPFKFTEIDSGMYNLFHLRYIALSSDLSVLPSKFNNLWNLQTLIVDTTCRTLKVEVDIWKMIQLRHFKTNAAATLTKSNKSGKEIAKLQTLGLISVESCTEDLPDRAPNLKKLGIRGQLDLLFDRRNESFDSLGKMRELEKLKLMNDAFPNPRSEWGLGGLPQHERFPPSLTSLTLCSTFISWEHISILGLLEKLKVLKLKDNAFTGSVWEAVDGGFRCLEVLHIEEADFIDWNASSHHYPNLRCLVLKNCEKLREIPTELADIARLQKLELYTCRSAAQSAKDISDAKNKTLPEGFAFMLSIYPPLE